MRILVVEDEPNVLSALQAGLMAEGFDVDTATDGETGLWMDSEVKYALVALEFMLPKLDGYSVCSSLRKRGNTSPILMLTARSGDEDLAYGLDTGADDYLTKPFSFVVLMARIRALLRRSHIRRDDTLAIGDLLVDRGRRLCRCLDEEISLTHREFALIETLALADGRVLSKQYLLDQVRGSDFNGGTNVVEVYVGYLRRKLPLDRLDTTLQTVHGHGYRLSS